MANKHTNLPKMPIKDRLGVRLGLLFAATFGALFLAGAVYSIFSTFVERRQADAEVMVQPVAVVIDPKIQTELAKAIAFDVMPTDVAVQDPFVDRSGISTPASTVLTVATAQGSSAGSGRVQTALQTNAGPASTITIGPGMNTLPQVQIDAKARYQNWSARQNAGEFAGPESEALSIEDLVPVGFVSGGSGYPEVMFYSLALCRTFSFPAGTHFADGWLSSVSEQEVVFAVDRLVKRKSFSRPDPCPAETKSVGAAAGSSEQSGTGE